MTVRVLPRVKAGTQGRNIRNGEVGLVVLCADVILRYAVVHNLLIWHLREGVAVIWCPHLYPAIIRTTDTQSDTESEPRSSSRGKAILSCRTEGELSMVSPSYLFTPRGLSSASDDVI